MENVSYKFGIEKGQPAYVAYKPAITELHTETQNFLYARKMAREDVNAVIEVPEKFVAPNAHISPEMKIEKGAGVWYHAHINGRFVFCCFMGEL